LKRLEEEEELRALAEELRAKLVNISILPIYYTRKKRYPLTLMKLVNI